MASPYPPLPTATTSASAATASTGARLERALFLADGRTAAVFTEARCPSLLLLEPSGACFTYTDHTGASSVRQMSACALTVLRDRVRAALEFRNRYARSPRLVRAPLHATGDRRRLADDVPQSVGARVPVRSGGLPPSPYTPANLFEADVTVQGEPLARSLRWPRVWDDHFCTEHPDGSVTVTTLDRGHRVTIAGHGQRVLVSTLSPLREDPHGAAAGAEGSLDASTSPPTWRNKPRCYRYARVLREFAVDEVPDHFMHAFAVAASRKFGVDWGTALQAGGGESRSDRDDTSVGSGGAAARDAAGATGPSPPSTASAPLSDSVVHPATPRTRRTPRDTSGMPVAFQVHGVPTSAAKAIGRLSSPKQRHPTTRVSARFPLAGASGGAADDEGDTVASAVSSGYDSSGSRESGASYVTSYIPETDAEFGRPALEWPDVSGEHEVEVFALLRMARAASTADPVAALRGTRRAAAAADKAGASAAGTATSAALAAAATVLPTTDPYASVNPFEDLTLPPRSLNQSVLVDRTPDATFTLHYRAGSARVEAEIGDATEAGEERSEFVIVNNGFVHVFDASVDVAARPMKLRMYAETALPAQLRLRDSPEGLLPAIAKHCRRLVEHSVTPAVQAAFVASFAPTASRDGRRGVAHANAGAGGGADAGIPGEGAVESESYASRVSTAAHGGLSHRGTTPPASVQIAPEVFGAYGSASAGAVVERAEVAGHGVFTMYGDGRVRVRFADLTLLALGPLPSSERDTEPEASPLFVGGAATSAATAADALLGAAHAAHSGSGGDVESCEMVLPDGGIVTLRGLSPRHMAAESKRRYRPYVRAALEFREWANLTPAQRAAAAAHRHAREVAVQSAVESTKRFLAVCRIREGLAPDDDLPGAPALSVAPQAGYGGASPVQASPRSLAGGGGGGITGLGSSAAMAAAMARDPREQVAALADVASRTLADIDRVLSLGALPVGTA